MASGRKFTTLTLVIGLFCTISAYSAPDLSTNEIKESPPSEEESPPSGLSDMKVAPSPLVDTSPIKPSKNGVYFPYQSSLSARFGLGTDTNLMKNNIYYYFYGLQYQLPSDSGIHWEAGADVMNDGTGVFSFGRKFRFYHEEAMRPYFKIAGALHTIPSEQLTTFLRTDNYQVRPAMGFEYFLEHPSSVRMEFESWISLKYIGYHISAGYSYAW